MDDYWVWCGSAINGDDGLYHMFASRWSKKYPMFEGYILSSEIVRAVSKTPEGPYSFAAKVLPAGSLENWDGRMAHNPTIKQYQDKYYLFYIASTFAGPLPDKLNPDEPSPQRAESYGNIKIGMVSADSPTGPWTGTEAPVLNPRPAKWDSKIVTNPAPCILPDGKTYLYYRSNTPQGLRIGLAVADSPEGPFERIQDEPVLKDFDVEDPFVWHNGDCFQMLAKDMTGKLTGEKHAGVYCTSKDGIQWEKLGKAYSRQVLWDNGQLVEQGCLERPQILMGPDGKPSVLFVATADGPGGFRNASNTWNAALPLA